MKKLLYILLFVPLAFFGQDNYSYSFDGVNDYLNIQNNSFESYSSFSLSGWIKISSSHGKIVDIGNNSENTEVTNQQRITLQVENNEIDFFIKYSDAEPWGVNEFYIQNIDFSNYFNNWTYLSATWDGHDAKLYFNGVLVGNVSSEDFNSVLISDYHNFNFCSRYTGSDNLEAILFNFSFWNTPLTQEEIQSYMLCSPLGQEEGLVGYWNLSEGSGDTIYDLSGNGNYGIIYGASFSEDVPEDNCDYNNSSAEYSTLLSLFQNSFSTELLSNISPESQLLSYENTVSGNISFNLTQGAYYILSVGGSATLCFNSSNCNHDALYAWSQQSSNNYLYIDTLTYEYIGPVFPDYESYYLKYSVPNNFHVINSDYNEFHEYWFLLEGTSSEIGFSFLDEPNAESDNYGDLNFNLYEIPQSLIYNLLYYGCMDSDAINFDTEATIDDGSCISQEEYIIDSLQAELENLNNDATTSLSSLQQVLDTWNVSIDLSSGWNMFGYGCPSSTDVAEGLSNHTESIIITKDNSGNVYMPEFGFNGIGDFTPGYGYQIKLIEAIEGFSLCDWYVNDIPEDNIVSLQDSLQLINSLIGCTDSLACNYYINKLYDDGSCEHPEQGYDCDGNEWIYSISFSGLNNQYFESYVNNLNSSNGEFISISFWFNPLVGQNESSVISIGGYQLVFYNNGFGFNHSVGDLYGVDTSVFTDSTWSYITAIFYDAFDNQNAHAFEKLYINGQQQTLNCISPINGGFDCNSNLSPPTPLNIGLYSQNIRVGSPYDGSNYIGEIADLIVFNGELSSQEIHNIYCSNDSDLSSKVAHWNFNQEEGVLTDISGSGNDGIIYGGIIGHQIPELNCNNEVYSYQVGDLAEGGIVFYVDESGEHGLVAAVDDMPILYNWMDAQTASENYSIDNYDDWYLPSIENQQLIYQNINNHSSYLPHSSITEFSYWSSTEDSESHAFGFGYYNGEVGSHNKTLLRIVRPIRSF